MWTAHGDTFRFMSSGLAAVPAGPTVSGLFIEPARYLDSLDRFGEFLRTAT